MIYVDPIKIYPGFHIKVDAKRYGAGWCHLTTDNNNQKLHDFAKKIGLQRTWFQEHSSMPHYDLTPRLRNVAIENGARMVTSAEMVQKCSLIINRKKREFNHVTK